MGSGCAATPPPRRRTASSGGTNSASARIAPVLPRSHGGGRSAARIDRTESMMSDTPAAQPQTATSAPPPLVINIQYIKDLSFEVPGAPQVYTSLRAAPRVDINLDVQA